MEWVRREMIGKGSFSSVYLATPRNNFNHIHHFAVKSSLLSQSHSLQYEREILSYFTDSPEILQCFGQDYTEEHGESFYNLLLEFASKGNLAQMVNNSGGSMGESDVKYYTRSILRGLKKIHEKGFVHCDLKLQNLLVCDGCQVKIGDFGLAKKTGEKVMNSELRGTPLYMSPESVSKDEYEAPMDVWALGCVVSEMISGKPAWRCKAGTDVSALLFRIGFGDELPEIPAELSDQGKDFLKHCFVRDAEKRWTTEMLLNHPFVCDDVNVPLRDCGCPSPSPRSAFEFPESNWHESSSISSQWGCPVSSSDCLDDRIRQLTTENVSNWDSSGEDSWITVRERTGDLKQRSF